MATAFTTPRHVTVSAHMEGLGARRAIGGQRLALRLPRRVQPQQQLPRISAFLLNPALLSAVGRMAVRLIPGKLLVQAASKAPLSRLATPFTVALLAYSIGVTLYATMRKPQPPAAAASLRRDAGPQPPRAPQQPSAGLLPRLSLDTDSLGSMDLSDSEGGTVAGVVVCKVCRGEGQVETRAKRNTIPCPCCLGKGFVWK